MDFSSPESWIDALVIAIALIAVVVGGFSAFKLFNAQSETKNDTPQLKSPPDKKAISVSSRKQSPQLPKSDTKPAKPLIEKIKEKQEPPKTVADQLKSPIVNKTSKPAAVPEKPKKEKPVAKIEKPIPKEGKKIFELPVTAHVVEPTVPKRKSFFGRITQRKSNNKSTVHESLSGGKTPREPELIPEKLTLRSANSMSLSLRNNGGKLIYRKVTPGKNNELEVVYQNSNLKLKTIMEEYPMGSSITFFLNGNHVISRTYQFDVHYLDTDGNEFSQKISGLGKEYPIVEQPVRHLTKK